MARTRRTNEPIKVIAKVYVGGQKVDVDDLNQEQKIKLATWLKTEYLNAMFAGRAVFYPADTKDGGKTNEKQTQAPCGAGA